MDVAFWLRLLQFFYILYAGKLSRCYKTLSIL